MKRADEGNAPERLELPILDREFKANPYLLYDTLRGEGKSIIPVRLRARAEAHADLAFDAWISEELTKLWTTPALFPISMRPADNTLVLVPLSQAQYQSLSFLDDREIPMARCLEVPLDRLIEASQTTIEARRKTVHGIFHMAFCGSTLLARCNARHDDPGQRTYSTADRPRGTL